MRLCVLLLAAATALVAPVAPRKPAVTEIHGEKRVDDYAWLRDKNDPEVIAHLEAENAYTDAVLKPTEALQQKIDGELRARTKETDLSLPTQRGEYLYYSRTEAGKQYEIYARKKGSLDAPEEIVLDLNVLARGHEYIDLGVYTSSNDGNLLAYSIDTTGNGVYTLAIKNLATGEVLPYRRERVSSAAWAGDNKTLFFVADDATTQRPFELNRYVLGSDKADVLYREGDELFRLGVSRTRDREIILADSISKTSNETRFIPAGAPAAELKVIVPRTAGHRYIVDHRDDQFYIRTNDRAPNYRLVTAPVSDPSMANWKEIVPARNDVELFEVNVFANYLALSEVKDGNRIIRIVDLRTGKSTPITFGEASYNLSRDVNADFNTTKFRYRYNSLLTPEAIYEFDMEKHANVLLKKTEVPNYDQSQFASELLWAKASDGTRVPVSIVYKKPLVRNGKRPLLLYGYGSYGVPMWPFFIPTRLPLLDRGVIYAVVNPRGGGGMGRAWVDAGRMMQKRNTFTDFIAAAEHLLKSKYTSSDRLVITGHSAGGMLVGAATNMRPDLFKAVVATSPFVDVLNTMLDPSLPQTTIEYIEWGNPNKRDDYAYIKSYAPYDNIRAAKYPAVLVTVSLNDNQVKYWEGAKYVAKLRAMNTGPNPVLLRVNMGGGHAGSSGRYDALRELAFLEAFELWQMGIRQ